MNNSQIIYLEVTYKRIKSNEFGDYCPYSVYCASITDNSLKWIKFIMIAFFPNFLLFLINKK